MKRTKKQTPHHVLPNRKEENRRIKCKVFSVLETGLSDAEMGSIKKVRIMDSHWKEM